MKVAEPPDRDFTIAVPPSTDNVTFPVAVPFVAVTLTVTTPLALYVTAGALIEVVVKIGFQVNVSWFEIRGPRKAWSVSVPAPPVSVYVIGALPELSVVAVPIVPVFGPDKTLNVMVAPGTGVPFALSVWPVIVWVPPTSPLLVVCKRPSVANLSGSGRTNATAEETNSAMAAFAALSFAQQEKVMFQ